MQNQKTIEENNILIAEFMGLDKEVFKSGKINYYYEDQVTNQEIFLEAHELSYNVSWSWLMQVVEKIESLGYIFTIQGAKAECGEMISKPKTYLKDNKLLSTYMAVIEFIKEYNI